MKQATPEQFKAAKETLGLSSAVLGAALGVDGRTVRRWGSSVDPSPIPVMAALLMEQMLRKARRKR